MIVNFNWQKHKLVLLLGICVIVLAVALIAELRKPEPPPQPQTPEDAVKSVVSSFLMANEEVAIVALAGYNTSMAMIDLCGVGEAEAKKIRESIGGEAKKLSAGLSDKGKGELKEIEKAFKKEWDAKSKEQRKEECDVLGASLHDNEPQPED